MASLARTRDLRGRSAMTVRVASVEPGTAHPLGATVVPAASTFSVYSKRATGIELLLFDGVDDAVPGRVIRLDPHAIRTGEYWHALVPGLAPGQVYAFAAHGPWAPERGSASTRRSSCSIRTGAASRSRPLPPRETGEPTGRPVRRSRASSSMSPATTGRATSRSGGGSARRSSTRRTSAA